MSPDVHKSLQEILSKLLNPIIGDAFSLEILKEAEQWRVNIQTSTPEPLFEENQGVLTAVQHLTRVLLHKLHPKDFSHFIIDVNNFKHARGHALKVRIPDITKSKVLDSGKTVILINLTSYERKIVHNILADIKGVETKSIGEGASRKLLVLPTSEFGAGTMDESIILDINKLPNEENDPQSVSDA